MAGAGAVLAGTVLHARRGSEEKGARSGGATDATVILQGERHAFPRDLAQRLAGGDARVIQLEADPVRQWRGPRSKLLAARGTRLFGITSWPQFLIVRGLAEESGRRVRYQRLDASNGTIRWVIA
jgi:hypothetical protein